MIPIDPAKETNIVLAFLVKRFFPDKDKAVKKDIECFLVTSLFETTSSLSKGLESFTIVPSTNSTILVEYLLANSGLWVTMIISFSFDISFNISIT